MNPMLILVTGDPVPETHDKRGGFARLIREATGNHWSGAWDEIDCRGDRIEPPAAQPAAVIITGSPESVAVGAPWMTRTQAYVADLVQRQVPVLGVCFGHQLLAAALGGRVEQNPNGREMGTVEVEVLEDDPLIDRSHRPYTANMSHVDSVTELPRGARHLARTQLEPHAVIRFAELAWGVQFHPEMDAQIVGHYAAARRDTLRDEGLDARAIAAGATDAAGGASVLGRFASLVERIVR